LDEFSFIIKDSMSWFDRSAVLFDEIDKDDLAEKTYVAVNRLKERLKKHPNIIDLKHEHLIQMALTKNSQERANTAVSLCIVELDKLLNTADIRFNQLQSALVASVEFGYSSVFATMFSLILLTYLHFNTIRQVIQKKFSDLASINKIGRQLALVKDQSTALKITLDTICEKNGLEIGIAFLMNNNELKVAWDHLTVGENCREETHEWLPNLSIIKRMNASKNIIYIPNVANDSQYGIDTNGANNAFLSIPLIENDNLFGVLCFSGRSDFSELDSNDYEFLGLIAGVLVSTLQNIEMRVIIEAQNRSLEGTIKERTAALKQKNDDTTSMLTNLHQGLFTITKGGLIHSEYAPFLAKIFETNNISNREFSEFLFEHSQLDKTSIEQVKNTALAILHGKQGAFERLSSRLVNDLILTFPNNHVKNVILSWDQILNESKQVVKLLVTVRDVTDHHKAEEQKEVLAAVFKNSAEAIAVFDKALYIQAVNAAFCDLMSMNDEYLVGSNLSTVLRNMHDGSFFDSIRTDIENSGCWDGEIRCDPGESSDKTRWLTVSEIGQSKSSKTATFLGSFSDILRRQKVEDELRYLANYDALTSLPNRRLFTERVEHALALAKRNSTRVALFFIDLNRFKHINDSYGHSIGDELLIQVTQRLNEFVRESDILSRLGGDEFTILIENPVSSDDVEMFASRLLQQFTQPFNIANHELRTDASIGISVFPDDAESVETLMINADVAMYSAKKRGVGFLFFESKMNETSGLRLGLENDLYKALENNELFLTYQPKIELCTGQMVGAEVLLRWEHPELGLISPDQFIPLAEETGLIVPIGHWVLETACKNLEKWRKEGLYPIKLAVNVSAKQFQTSDFVEQVQKVLEDTSLDPALLELEVTESLLMDTENTSIEIMTNLKEMGISISIDDFGTGYSSLQYLSKFPIDYLKIDRSFVMGLDTGGKSIAIIRAIIAMAEGLGLEVVAEGVEDDGQARLLREFGCQLAQGYLYSRPLKEVDFIKHLSPQKHKLQALTFLQR